MKSNRTLWLAGFGTLAGATFLLSAVALWALNGGGQAQLGSLALMKLAAGYDRRAEPILAPAHAPPPRLRRQAAALSQAATAQFPYDTGAWLRLAYVDALDHGGLTSDGLKFLKRSYDLVAIDPQLGPWRVRFALENSQALTPELRAAARTETSALWKNGENREKLTQLATTIHNPAGRLSAALWLNRLAADVAK
jgi:hypothetical protein